MSSSPAELVRSIFSEWARGEYFEGDWASPDIEFVIADGPEPGRWSRVAEMADFDREPCARGARAPLRGELGLSGRPPRAGAL